MLFRYSELCGMASDAVDAVRSAIPTGFNFKNSNESNPLKFFLNPIFLKFETLILGFIIHLNTLLFLRFEMVTFLAFQLQVKI